jgi:hypothetical protein
MRKFLVLEASIENVNVLQSEAGVEEPPPNVANEFNSNEIVIRVLGNELMSMFRIFKTK